MRQAVTISIPEETLKDIQREAKLHSFANTSEFFRHMFRQWKKDHLSNDIKQGKRDLRAGKGKVLRSFKDLR